MRPQKPMFRSLFFCVLVCLSSCFLSLDVFAQQGTRLSLHNVLELLLRRNPTLAQERLRIRQSQADLLVARGAFGFDLSLDLKLNRTGTPLNMQIDSSVLGALDSNPALGRLSLDTSFLLSKRFVLGTTASIGFVQSWRTSDTPRFSDLLQGKKDLSFFQTQLATTTFTLQVTQPLLKGAWFSVNLAPIWQSLERVQVMRLQVSMVALQQVGLAARAYWDLVYARHNLVIKREALHVAERQLKKTLGLIRAGKMAKVERYQVLQVVSMRKGEILLAEDLVTKAETQLRLLLRLPTGHLIRPISLPDASMALPAQKDLVLRALLEHPQIVVAKKQLAISRWSVVIAKNAMLPELNLTSRFAFVGSGRVQYGGKVQQTDSALGQAYGTLFDPNYHRFYVGLQLKVPLDNRRAKGRLQRDQVEVQRALLGLSKLQHQIRAEVRRQYKQLTRTKQRISLARISVMWAKKKLEVEQAKLKVGKSTLYNVLGFQQDLANTKLSELRAKIDYQKALIWLYEKAGVLLKHYRIEKR